MTILLVGLVVLATHALEAVTGFGCTVLALPLVTALLGLREGVMVLTILAWVLALYIVVSKRRNLDLRRFAVIVAFVLAGLPVGMYLFRTADAQPLKRVLAVFIVLAAAAQLLFLLKGKPWKPPRVIGYLILVAGGVVHGLFSSGGPLVVLYASAALPEKGAFRATLCLLWLTLNSIIIGSYLAAGSLTPKISLETAALLPFLVLGIFIGERLHERVQPRAFSAVVFSTLLATGVVMLLMK